MAQMGLTIDASLELSFEQKLALALKRCLISLHFSSAINVMQLFEELEGNGTIEPIPMIPETCGNCGMALTPDTGICKNPHCAGGFEASDNDSDTVLPPRLDDYDSMTEEDEPDERNFKWSMDDSEADTSMVKLNFIIQAIMETVSLEKQRGIDKTSLLTVAQIILEGIDNSSREEEIYSECCKDCDGAGIWLSEEFLTRTVKLYRVIEEVYPLAGQDVLPRQTDTGKAVTSITFFFDDTGELKFDVFNPSRFFNIRKNIAVKKYGEIDIRSKDVFDFLKARHGVYESLGNILLEQRKEIICEQDKKKAEKMLRQAPPILQKEIARFTGLSESTISREICHWNIVTPYNIAYSVNELLGRRSKQKGLNLNRLIDEIVSLHDSGKSFSEIAEKISRKFNEDYSSRRVNAIYDAETWRLSSSLDTSIKETVFYASKEIDED